MINNNLEQIILVMSTIYLIPNQVEILILNINGDTVKAFQCTYLALCKAYCHAKRVLKKVS